MSPQPTTETIHHISVPLVVPSRWQPRQSFDPEYILELAKSIKSDGQMYPIILFRNGDQLFELVAGECRTRATIALGLTQCPTWRAEHGNGLRSATGHIAEHGWTQLADDIKAELVTTTIDARIEPEVDLTRLHKLAVIDNIRRANLTPFEEARAFRGLMEEQNISQRALASELGCSQSKIQERLALLNLAPEARQALTTRAVSPSHARHLAKLPVKIQPAVTELITELVDRDGDQATTVRQVAVLTSQIKKFLNPDHWLPPDEPITPSTRNNLRLVRHLLQHVDLEQRGEDILQLRRSHWSGESLIGKKPVGLRDDQITEICRVLAGNSAALSVIWQRVAHEQDWDCAHCYLADLQPPSESGPFNLPCARWSRPPEGGLPDTCRGFVGPEDPLVIPVSRELGRWAEEHDPAHLVAEPFYHFDLYAPWVVLVALAAARRAELQLQAKQERQTKHVREIAGYWQRQRGLWSTTGHFQMHRCDRCTHYRPDQLDDDLPPCLFAVEPLTNQWNDDPRAPEFGVLIRQDGLMLPRCEMYRRGITTFAPTPGFVLPDREVVIEWLHRILTGFHNGTQHSYTIRQPLTWLPYPRQAGQVHDLARLLSYVKKLWKTLDGARLATLISTAASEVAALSNYNEPFQLLDPTTLEVEQWASTRWRNLVEGIASENSSYPRDWPQPWVKS